MSLINFIKDKIYPQRTKVYCPYCRNELIKNGELIDDSENGVLYRCNDCQGLSMWDFDAPTPLLMNNWKM